MAECPSCGADVAEGVRFCGQCGTRLDASATQTAVVALPDESGPVPIAVTRAEPHLFGITPPTTLLVVGAAALVAAIVVAAAGETLAAAILLAAAVLL
nr:zinc-ribbon domain-containing protein [Actinomycetota bacterium]